MPLSVRIKVCGITSVDDARAAVRAGANAIGLVFYEKSPRYVTVEQAQQIARSVPPFVAVAGLFVNAGDQEVKEVLAQVPLTLLQFHGDEDDGWCQGWQRQYIKALRVRPDLSLPGAIADYPGASGILLDAYRKGIPGGTGESFDWGLIPPALDKPLILAGGLHENNVAQAIGQVAPYAVDVSSGVESRPGIKDHDKLAAFIRAVERNR